MTHVERQPAHPDPRDDARARGSVAAARTAVRALVALVAVVVLTACGSVPPVAGLMVKPAGMAATCGLDGAVLTGQVRISVATQPEYQGVTFFLNSPQRTAPYRFVAEAPYEFVLDTTTLDDGSHVLEAYADLADGASPELVGWAAFVVANDAPGDPGGDPGGGPGGDPGEPGAQLPSDEYAHLRQLYVSPSGSDRNDGSAKAPLATVMAALARAVDDRGRGIGTRINLYDGVYREALVRSYASSGALIVLEAINPGGAVISGADVFADWSCSDGLCAHRWTEGWGPDPDPWGIGIGELARRRELVAVDGVNLEQVRSRDAMVAGSFFVDENAATLYVRPPSGTTLDGALVEVAVRPHAMRLLGLDDLVVKGLRFRHAASPFRRAAVEIVDQTNVLLEDAWVEWNGQNGVWLKGTHLTLRDVEMNHNGSSGVSGFQVADILIEDSESSYNNWRGIRVGYDGWEVGNKFFAAHRVVVRRHVSAFNQSRGLWFDIDIEDVLIEDSAFNDNTHDGLFIEKVRGPFTVRRSEFLRNGDAGIMTSAANGFTLERSRLEWNEHSAVYVSGDFEVTYTDFETGERHTLNNGTWTWRENAMTAPDDAPLIRTSHSSNQWDALIATSSFDLNVYTACITDAFGVPGRRITFAEWRADTGQDPTSTFVLTTVAEAP